MNIKFLVIAIATAIFFSACDDNGNSAAPQNENPIEDSSSDEAPSLSSSSFSEEGLLSSSSKNTLISSSSETKVDCYETTKESESGELEKYIECDDGNTYPEKMFPYFKKYNYGSNCTSFRFQTCENSYAPDGSINKNCYTPVMCPTKTWSD